MELVYLENHDESDSLEGEKTNSSLLGYWRGWDMTLTIPFHAHYLLCLTFFISVLTSSRGPLIHLLKGFQCLESLNLKFYPATLRY